MFPPQFLSLIEMLVFNSIICDRCCHRKYSLGKTIGILGSVFVFLLAWCFSSVPYFPWVTGVLLSWASPF